MAQAGQCSVCAWERGSGVKVDTSKSKTMWAEETGISRYSIKRHLEHAPTDARVLPESRDETSDGTLKLTKVSDRVIPLSEWLSDLAKDGHDPSDFTTSHGHSIWGQNSGDDGLVTLYANRFSAVRKKSQPVVEPLEIDPIDILKKIRKEWAHEAESGGGDSAFVISFNDTQFGKDEGGGTPATLARIDVALANATLRIHELRSLGRELGTLVIIGGGDIVEGCVIYPNQSYSLDLDRRGQINTAVTVILDMIDRLAPMFERVIVLATRGNHGENRINGNRTTLYDNDDTLVFELVQRATERDSTLKHVEYIIGQDEAGVYADICGWRLATTHGDVYGKGVAGATIDKKAQAWYKNMAMARNPLGSADVLVTHHWHHDKMSDWGSCIWRQTPAMDGGSKWFEQSSGEYSKPGMLSFVMTPHRRYQDEQVLR